MSDSNITLFDCVAAYEFCGTTFVIKNGHVTNIIKEKEED